MNNDQADNGRQGLLNPAFGLVADNGQVYHARQNPDGSITPASDLLPAGVKPAADKPVWIAGQSRYHP